MSSPGNPSHMVGGSARTSSDWTVQAHRAQVGGVAVADVPSGSVNGAEAPYRSSRRAALAAERLEQQHPARTMTQTSAAFEAPAARYPTMRAPYTPPRGYPGAQTPQVQQQPQYPAQARQVVSSRSRIPMTEAMRAGAAAPRQAGGFMPTATPVAVQTRKTTESVDSVETALSALSQIALAPRLVQAPLEPKIEPASRRSKVAGRAKVTVRQVGVSGPQMGVAGVLGLATIASPLSGMTASAANTHSASPVAAMVSSTGAALPGKQNSTIAGVSTVQVFSPVGNDTAAAALAAMPSGDVLVTKPSRDRERAILPGCDGVVTEAELNSIKNGFVPKSTLCTLWQSDRQLRADAAVALAKLNLAYRQAFGKNLYLNSDYRSYGEQDALYEQKPAGMAARPGKSNHGWGLAVDIDVDQSYNSRTYRWLRENARAYGWENPDWAVQGGSGWNEPWHWEYFPGTARYE